MNREVWSEIREIMLKYTLSPYAKEYEIGDRVGQLIIMPYPRIELEETEELTPTERGDGGYGSTGR